MRKKYLTEYENPKAWDRVRELCQQIESGQLDDKIPEIMDEINNFTPPTETQYLWVNCYEESCDMDRELIKSLKKRISQIKLNENMNKNRIRLTESQLHRVIKESVKRILNEGVEDIVAQLSKLEDRICEISREIKRVFFENERKFDNPKYARFVRMGLDNPPYSFGSQGELSYAFDTEEWNEWTGGRGPRFEDELREVYKWFKQLQYLADCEGYGPGAAARGFDVSSSIGVFWTKSSEAIRILNKMAELTNIKL